MSLVAVIPDPKNGGLATPALHLDTDHTQKVTRLSATMVNGRSRTGCLTCRQRKLKCDEQKPVCSQCLKANRECRPSEAVVFRHQQNASMNAAGIRSDGNLPSFYGYRNTFNTDHTWVKIPEQITFVHTSNPFADDPDADPGLSADSPATVDAPRADWGPDAAYRPSTHEFAAHSLEHLAAAASDQYPYSAQTAGAGHGLMSTAPHYTPYQSQDMLRPPAPSGRARLTSTSTTTSYPSNNISAILNHSSTLSPVIDPSLQPVIPRQPMASDSPATETRSLHADKREGKVQDDHEIAALLRGIAEDHPTQRQEGSVG